MEALTADELARAAHITPKHADRILREIHCGKRTLWREASPKLVDEAERAGLLLVKTHTLPLTVREAVLMWDQMALSFPLPSSRLNHTKNVPQGSNFDRPSNHPSH